MPATTPVFGLPYPVAGDPVDPNTFANLAAAIDSALVLVAAERTQMLRKPFLQLVRSSALVVAAGVEATLTWDTEQWDTDGMFPGPGGTTVTIATAGVYSIDVLDAQLSGYATFVDGLWSLFVNGNRMAAEKKPATNTGGGSPVADVMWVWPLNAGDQVQVRALFNGTGSTASIVAMLQMSLICPLV